MDPATASGLLLEAAPLLDADQLTQLEEGGWFLVFEGGQVIDVDLDEAVPRMVLAGEAGPLPAGNDPRRLEMMLAYNALWTTHGGLRTALDLEGRKLLLLLDVPTQGLDAQSLTAVISNFRAALGAWAELLRADPAAQASMQPPGIPDFGLRV